MVPKNDSIKKKTPKKQAHPTTYHIRNEATNNESSGSVKKYPLKEVVEPNKILTWGSKDASPKYSHPPTRKRMKIPRK